MRKKVYICLALVCICMMTLLQPVLADSAPRLSATADAAKADKGQTVKVCISLKNNPKISTLGMTLSYDTDAFEYKDCSWSSSIGENDMKMASGEDGKASLSLVCDESYGADGVVATVSFQAKKDGAVVDMDLSLREMSDQELSDVTNCKVTRAVSVPEATEKKDAKETEEVAAKKAATKETAVKKTAKKNESQQSTAAPTVKPVSTSNSSTSAKTDESYQTGVLAGDDVLFVIAAVCGLAAFIFWNESKKEA